jgi:steroid delta-isomerase-like uncharacterized protein
MSAEENKAAIRRFTEGISRGDITAVDDFVTDDVRYVNAPPGLAPGIEGYRQLMGMFLTAFPDLQLSVEDMVSEGDKVVARIKGRGTHRGDFMGVPPTGKTVEAGAITIMQFRDGKVAEEWEQIDVMGLMQQLGAVPAPA